MACLYGFFYFYKQKTAYEMRISDWSSDVCSSDLREVHLGLLALDELGKFAQRARAVFGRHFVFHLVEAHESYRRERAMTVGDHGARIAADRTGDDPGDARCPLRTCANDPRQQAECTVFE